MVKIYVPGSCANLGPGFDALGVAVSLGLEVETCTGGAVEAASEDHPAVRAYRALGGTDGLAVRGALPPGRGLGFSGAARVGGALAAALERGDAFDDARDRAFEVASAHEGHPDNVAASLFGGVVATAAGLVVRVPLASLPAIVIWVPDGETATDHARAQLPDVVPFEDAVFNVGRTALLVAALAAGDVRALRAATEDRLHQDQRFTASPGSRAALDAALEAGAWCAFLSGSGPAVAAFAATEDAARVGAALPGRGDAHVLRIDRHGARVRG